MAQTQDLLTLALLPDVGPRRAAELRGRGLPEVLAHPADHADQLSAQAQRLLASGAARRRADEETARASRAGLRIVGLDEPEYPDFLAHTFDPPSVLWVDGVLEPDEGARSLAIVGSRAASPAGRNLARRMARELAGAGQTIVSGLARGIDTAAHLGALDARGRTVAVLGSALDHIYPRENAPLVERVTRRGAVVSEFPLGTRPARGHFPRRNRLIAGWGRVVVVVEAGARSGALGTVRCALDEGRDVMVVPGHPSSPSAQGVNRLLHEGALPVRNAHDVANELGIEPLPRRHPAGNDGETDPVLAALCGEVPQGLEALQIKTGLPVPELLGRLGQLEISEKARRLPGALYVRAS